MFGIKLRKIILILVILIFASQLLRIISVLLEISHIIVSGDITPYVALLLSYSAMMTFLPTNSYISKFQKFITSIKWIGGFYLGFLTVLVAMRFGSFVAVPAILLLWAIKEDKLAPFLINGIHTKKANNEFYVVGQTNKGILIFANGIIQEIRVFLLNGRQVAIPSLMQIELNGHLVIMRSHGNWYGILSANPDIIEADVIKIEQYCENVGISASFISDPLLNLAVVLLKSLNLQTDEVLAGIAPVVSNFSWTFLNANSQIIPENFLMTHYGDEKQRDKEIAHVDKMARLIAKSMELSFRDFYELYIASDFPPPVLNKKHKEVIDRYRHLMRSMNSYILIGFDTQLEQEQFRENPILSIVFDSVSPSSILTLDEITRLVFTSFEPNTFSEVLDSKAEVRQEA